MAYDKIVDSGALDAALGGIADAIRDKTGGTEPLTLDGMAAAIAGISAGGSVPGITVDTVVMAATTTNAATTYDYISTLFPALEQSEPFVLKMLIAKNIDEAKKTNNHLIAAFAHYLATKSPTVFNTMVRYRDGAYSTASGGSSAFDTRVNAGDEFLMVTIKSAEVWA